MVGNGIIGTSTCLVATGIPIFLQRYIKKGNHGKEKANKCKGTLSDAFFFVFLHTNNMT